MTARRTTVPTGNTEAAPVKRTAAPRPVTPGELDKARQEVRRLEDAMVDGPSQRARLADAREKLGDLEARQAEQQRAAVVQGITAGMDAAQARLEATRASLGAALAGHADALCALLEAVSEHNTAVTAARTLFADRGLTARRDDREGCVGNVFDHSEGARIAGTDWTPVPPEGITAYAVRSLFARAYGPSSPLARVLEHHYRPAQVEARADGLKLPPVPPSFTLRAPQAPAGWGRDLAREAK